MWVQEGWVTATTAPLVGLLASDMGLLGQPQVVDLGGD